MTRLALAAAALAAALLAVAAGEFRWAGRTDPQTMDPNLPAGHAAPRPGDAPRGPAT